MLTKFRAGQTVEVVGLQVILVKKYGAFWLVASSGFEFYCRPSELRKTKKVKR